MIRSYNDASNASFRPRARTENPRAVLPGIEDKTVGVFPYYLHPEERIAVEEGRSVDANDPPGEVPAARPRPYDEYLKTAPGLGHAQSDEGYPLCGSYIKRTDAFVDDWEHVTCKGCLQTRAYRAWALNKRRTEYAAKRRARR